MNNPTRKQLQKIIDDLEVLKSELEEINDEEQEKLENIPESFQSTERYERAENVCGYLEDAISSFEELVENITNAIEE